MKNNNTVVKRFRDKRITITHTFDVPGELVWDCWTRPEHVVEWWGPHGFAMADCTIDLRIGGKWRYVLRKQNGRQFHFSGVYTEIVRPTKLAYTDGIDIGGTRREALTSVIFEDRNGSTRLTSHTVFPSRLAMLMALATGMAKGMVQTMERLDRHLKGANPPSDP